MGYTLTSYHANLVMEKSTLRKLIEVATEIVQRGYEASEGSGEIIDRAEELIFSINDPRLKRGFVPLKGLLGRAVEVIQEIGKFVEHVASDPAIKGAILTSAKPAFMAGAELKHIVEIVHGGTLSVTSEVGKGSTFRFELPLVK